MTEEQRAEIMRLASVYATARVIRHRAQKGDIQTVTLDQANARVERAQKALSDYLTSI